MDSVTQIVLGGAVAATIGYKQLGRSSLVIGAVLATLPDLDIFLPAKDAVTSFTEHRGFSHSLFVLFPFAFLCFSILKLKFNSHIISNQRLFWLCCLVLITHPLLDAFTSYGTQLFWPLAVQPIAVASIFAIDPLYTLPLLIGCTYLWWAGKADTADIKNKKARRINHLGLILSSSCLLLGFFLQTSMLNRVENILHVNNITKDKIFISPLYPSLNWWGAIVVDSDNDVYYDVELNVLTNTIEISDKKDLGYSDLEMTIDSLTSLNWFTKGFIRLENTNEKLIATDLRMKTGQLGYAFKFSIAEKKDNNWQIITPIRL